MMESPTCYLIPMPPPSLHQEIDHLRYMAIYLCKWFVLEVDGKRQFILLQCLQNVFIAYKTIYSNNSQKKIYVGTW